MSHDAPSGRNPSRMPMATPGMRIGLLGGSFNPAHAAHRAISLFAMQRLALDRVWWLVSPGNPLKDTSRLPPLAERVAQARRIAASSVIDVTGIEATLGTRYTYDTVSRLRSRLPGVRFVVLMGADILFEFHRWKRWRELADLLPLAVIDRAGWTFRALASPAAHALASARFPENKAGTLPDRIPPAWAFLHGRKLPLSSTAIRISTGSPKEG